MNRKLRFAMKAVPLVLLAVAAFGFLVMSLWNWLVPAIFAGPEITFWQALGLLILSKLLLGGGHFRGRRPHWRRRMIERWERMTPEERERFRQGWSQRCGGPAMPAAPAE